MPRRHELSETQWNAIQDFLPGKASDSGRTAADNRLFVNAVLFVLKTGIPWDDLPERFGKPNSVWKRFDRWCAKGVWQSVFRAAILLASTFEGYIHKVFWWLLVSTTGAYFLNKIILSWNSSGVGYLNEITGAPTLKG